MKLSCGIVQDLLPLYVEKMACEESCRAVEEHLEDCVDCRRVWEEMEQSDAEEVTETVPIKKVSQKIRKRKWETVLCALCLAAAAALAFISWLTTPVYLTCEEADLQAEDFRKESGVIRVTLRGACEGYYMEGGSLDRDGIREYTIEAWRYRYGISQSNREILIEADETENLRIYYCDYSGEDQLIFGEADGGRITLPMLVLNYYMCMALGFAVICGILLMCVRKRKKMFRILSAVFWIPVSYLAGHLAIKGLGGTSAAAGRDLAFILLTAVFVYAAVMLAGSLIYEKG